MEARQNELIHVSDDESSSSSDDTTISLDDELVPANELVPVLDLLNNNIPTLLQSAAIEFKLLSHIVQNAWKKELII